VNRFNTKLYSCNFQRDVNECNGYLRAGGHIESLIDKVKEGASHVECSAWPPRVSCVVAEHGRRAQLSNEFRLKIQELSIANGTVVAALGQKLCHQHVPAGANGERGCNKRDTCMHVRVVKASNCVGAVH
jgi:hypothetical protein